MNLSLNVFLHELFSNIPLLITIILVLAVVFVNGWTDAPNAIASCVATRSISYKSAIIMAAIFNFLGVLVMTLINRKVAESIYNIVNFNAVIVTASNPALVALCAAFLAIVIWAVAAWYFGIPTSESHALIAGLSGSALAMNGISGINGTEWSKVLIGLLLSSVLGFAIGFVVVKFVEFVFRRVKILAANLFFSKAQVASGAAMAFMHGAQDGQKFIGVFIMAIFIVQGQNSISNFPITPMWLILLISLVMGIGTSIGGYRIIKTVGMDMVKLEKYQGFSADMAASACLLASSLAGIPVSTTHVKTTAIMGVGAAKRISSVDWKIVKEMIFAWVMTFPGCGLIGYLMTLLFINIFN